MSGITIVPLGQENEPQVRLDRTLWLNADRTKAVEDGDPESSFLYGIAGRVVPRAEAARLGALPLDELSPPPEPVKQAPKPKDKMAPRPEDK